MSSEAPKKPVHVPKKDGKMSVEEDLPNGARERDESQAPDTPTRDLRKIFKDTVRQHTIITAIQSMQEERDLVGEEELERAEEGVRQFRERYHFQLTDALQQQPGEVVGVAPGAEVGAGLELRSSSSPPAVGDFSETMAEEEDEEEGGGALQMKPLGSSSSVDAGGLRRKLPGPQPPSCSESGSTSLSGNSTNSNRNKQWVVEDAASASASP